MFIKMILKKMMRYYFLKKIIEFLYLFLFEYISNNIINHIPCVYIRYIFYKYILRLDISASTYIHMGQYIYPEIRHLHIGQNSIINRKCILDRRGGLYIGDNVNISSEVAIYTAGHEIDSTDFAYYTKSVYIDDYVWIGTRAMIMPGVRVGKGAMVMPGAIVTKNIDAYSIVAGIPAKVIGKRNNNLEYNLTWRSMFL